jgi:hypothetical protein
MLTPFSGLSLIVHLVVIGLAKIARIGKKNAAFTDTYREPFSTSGWVLKYALSIIVMLAISSIMIFSFTLALLTSIREASQEWHIQFINREWNNLFDNKFAPLEYRAENEPVSQPVAVNGVGVPPYEQETNEVRVAVQVENTAASHE